MATQAQTTQHLDAARQLLDDVMEEAAGDPQAKATAAVAHATLVLAEQGAAVRVGMAGGAAGNGAGPPASPQGAPPGGAVAPPPRRVPPAGGTPPPPPPPRAGALRAA